MCLHRSLVAQCTIFVAPITKAKKMSSREETKETNIAVVVRVRYTAFYLLVITLISPIGPAMPRKYATTPLRLSPQQAQKGANLSWNHLPASHWQRRTHSTKSLARNATKKLFTTRLSQECLMRCSWAIRQPFLPMVISLRVFFVQKRIH